MTAETSRPRWSVMIPTYECAGYLRGTLAAVLAQDPGPGLMQIEVVDDHSVRDDPEAVVREVGNGRIAFHRQPANVGHVANFNTCIARARGELVHLLHGDDLVAGGFYARMGRLFEQHPELGAAYCRYRIVDEQGAELAVPGPDQDTAGPMPDAMERIAARQPIQAPAVVVRREVYERLGGFDERMRSCGEDWEMWVRIAAAVPFGYEPATLADYRVHTASLTGRSLRSGQNMRDLRTAVAIYREHLPPRLAPLADAARDKAARWALTQARRLASQGQLAAAFRQIGESLRTATTWPTRAAALRTGAWLGRQALRRITGHRRDERAAS